MRLKPYKPQEKDFMASVKPSLAANESLDNYNSAEYVFVIDSPKNLAQKILVTIDVREYPDSTVADKRFWQLRETTSAPGPLYQNTRGFDVLTINGNSVKGLLGKNTFEMSCVGKQGVPDPFAGSNIKPNPDAGWYSGMADFMLDTWKEAQGLPHSGLGIALADPGPMKASVFREEPAQDLKKIMQPFEEPSGKSVQTNKAINSPNAAAAVLASPALNWVWIIALLAVSGILIGLLLLRRK